MFVDPESLRLGANESHRAGGQAQAGADALARGPLVAAMFGDFAAADAFHEALGAAHAQHVNNLQSHRETLSAVGTKAHYVATEFTNMDERSAAEFRAVRGEGAT